jgi:hypothetical protein
MSETPTEDLRFANSGHGTPVLFGAQSVSEPPLPSLYLGGGERIEGVR